jgi:phosphoglycolate phosphatase
VDIYFDLDGTLIDSADGILASLTAALDLHGLVPSFPLNRDLIGPPLRQTLKHLTGDVHPAMLDRLTQAFKDHYDGEGCLRTLPYPGVPESLRNWAAEGHNFYIVTNKRLVPTIAILRHLNMESMFTSIQTLDGTTPPTPSKEDLVRGIRALQIHPKQAGFLVGDSADDGRAARANGLPFIFAEYGYGSLIGEDVPSAGRIWAFAELGSYLNGAGLSPPLL